MQLPTSTIADDPATLSATARSLYERDKWKPKLMAIDTIIVATTPVRNHWRSWTSKTGNFPSSHKRAIIAPSSAGATNGVDHVAVRHARSSRPGGRAADGITFALPSKLGSTSGQSARWRRRWIGHRTELGRRQRNSHIVFRAPAAGVEWLERASAHAEFVVTPQIRTGTN